MPDHAHERTYHEIFEAAPDGIVVVDHSGRIRLANQRLFELFGYHREDVIGQRIEMLVPERLRGAHERNRAAYAGDPQRREMSDGLTLLGRRRDGSEFPVEISLSPVEGIDGPLVTAIIRDVTEQRQSEDERQRLLAQVETQLVRDEIARDLHDEIIQAVYAVGLNLQAARTQDEVTKSQVLDRAGRELSAVIADLRSYIRHLTTEDPHITPSILLETRLRTLLERRHGMPSWSVKIELDGRPLGGLERELYLIARELISNVDRHSSAERASLSLQRREQLVELEVRDDGHGFDRAAVAEDSLGLRNVEQRVSELGGSVVIESKPGDGTTVSARIPVAVEESASRPAGR